jgi:archaellum component FlaG (FlaF/FlaG flagellin family)
VETLERTLKQLYDRLCIIAKRKRVVTLILAIIAVIFLSGIISGFVIVNVRSLYQTSNTISSVGTLKLSADIEVYRNKELTDRMTAIDWGTLKPGATKTYTIYVSNTGNLPLALSMSTSNWSPPSASNYLTLTWNYNGQKLNPGDDVQVIMTLTVSSSITGISNFNFDINLVGSG